MASVFRGKKIIMKPAINEPPAMMIATSLRSRPAVNKRPGINGPNTAPPLPMPSTNPDPELNRDAG
jgi:hypothetical protein